jgi:aspartyl-tRNA(Asn)/glutamyl-tRNA(Gln) amidotransferase subunit A|tara:strand:- start:709 stop:2169 length:1461 start_codon:yes stop_codon:yes gene_type:complete
MANEIYYKTIKQLRKLLDDREISSTELTKTILNRSIKINKDINSVITHTEDLAIKSAEAADKRISEGNQHLMTGIPVMIKDNISTQGIETTAGSKILAGYKPPFDATVIKRLKNVDAVICGKTNLDEFAMGSSTENSAYGATRNPWDIDKVPGGSSGGSAAGVAAGQCIIALGSDTGGSIRQPSAFCGVSGMKPTYGLISRYGLIAFGSSLDQIGPIARSVEDCSIVLNTISSKDTNDATSTKRPFENFGENLGEHIKGVKIGIPKEYLVDGIQPSVKQAFEKSLQILESNGAVLKEISLPLTDHSLSVYYIIAPSEASSNLARYDGVKYGISVQKARNSVESTFLTRGQGFGDEVKRRILLGTYALSAGYYDAYYSKAQKVRTLIRQEFSTAFETFDVLVTPTAPTTAFGLGTKIGDPYEMYLSDICTIPINIAGLPAISIPAGLDKKMPVGLQIIGPKMGDQIVLQVASNYEKSTNWNQKTPHI